MGESNVRNTRTPIAKNEKKVSNANKHIHTHIYKHYNAFKKCKCMCVCWFALKVKEMLKDLVVVFNNVLIDNKRKHT